MHTYEPRRTRGWWPIWAYVVAHNIWAAGRNQEMLSQAAARTRRAHPVIVPIAGLVLYAHLMGWLGRCDPLYWLGAAALKVRGPRG